MEEYGSVAAAQMADDTQVFEAQAGSGVTHRGSRIGACVQRQLG